MSRKNIVILIGSLLGVVLLALVLYSLIYNNASSKYSKEFKTLAIKNGWAKEQDFKSCNKEKESCISVAYSFINQALVQKAFYTNFNLDDLNTKSNTAEGLISNKKYKEALNNTKDMINIVNNNYQDYISKNQSNFDQIDSVVYEAFDRDDSAINVNYQIIDSWAKVLLLSKHKEIMPASLVLSKSTGKWTVVFGPATSITTSDNPNFPDKFFSENEVGTGVVVINEKGKKLSDEYYKPGSSITDSSTKDPLASYLPHYEVGFYVNSSKINGLTIYTVNYYDQDGQTEQSIKTRLQEWLKSINITVPDNQLKFNKIPVNSKNSED